MALYDLVTLRKTLKESMVADVAIDELIMLRTRISNIKLQVPVLAPEHASYINGLIEHYDSIIDSVAEPVDSVSARLAMIEAQINELTKKLFEDNTEFERYYGTVESVRNNRRIYLNSDVELLVSQRVGLYTDWRYPGLEIGCRDGEWTKQMVAADPLYIVDRHEEFLESTTEKFTPEYQRRLRKYHLADHNLTMLPQRQFGFVFSWGYFNYVSMPTMRKYLKQVYNLLRPGGVFMFSYNDGDTPAGAGMAENFAQSYMPSSLLLPMVKKLGYDVIVVQQPTANISWIELKRPGELKTVKAHQVMGEIRRIGH
jgi:SAM-dependent methyltransferase